MQCHGKPPANQLVDIGATESMFPIKNVIFKKQTSPSLLRISEMHWAQGLSVAWWAYVPMIATA